MWTREQLKDRAKFGLSKYYWMAFLVTFLGGLLSGGGRGGPTFNFNFGNSNWRSMNHYNNYGDRFGSLDISDPNFITALMMILTGVAVFSVVALIVMAISYAWQIFLGGPIEAGMNRYFLEARQDRTDFVNLFYSFRNGRYINTVKAMAWRLLFWTLWTLLLIIPGIVKGYAYSMVPYLLADNPGMDYKRALKLSMAMTAGQKFDIFVLDLSFIGWGLLGLLTCGIGLLFLNPYIYATKAELYVVLRQQAIERGLCTAEELNQPLPEASV